MESNFIALRTCQHFCSDLLSESCSISIRIQGTRCAAFDLINVSCLFFLKQGEWHDQKTDVFSRAKESNGLGNNALSPASSYNVNEVITSIDQIT